LPTRDKMIINPQDDEVRNAFGQANHIMLPFQSVILIEELDEKNVPKVMPFKPKKSD